MKYVLRTLGTMCQGNGNCEMHATPLRAVALYLHLTITMV